MSCESSFRVCFKSALRCLQYQKVPLPLEVVPALVALQLVAVHERAQQKESQWGVAERWAEHRWRT